MTRFGPLAFAVALFAPEIAWAAAPLACTDSYEQAQIQRKDGKMLAARDQLRFCAQPSCPGLIVSDCTRWLDELQSSIPSVVLLATDEAGTNLVGVTVSIDGARPLSASATQAIDVDPGPHHFTFDREGSPRAEVNVLVAIGEKNKRVQVSMRTAAGAPSLPGAPATGSPQGSPSASRVPLGVIGLAVGAAGLVSIGVGAIFGAEAISQRSDADCPSNVCHLPAGNPSALHTAWSDGNVSTAFFIAGGVVAAAGVTIWLLAPSRHAERTAWLRPLPVAMANGGGVVLVGGW